MTQQERTLEQNLLLEAGFFVAYGKAIAAGKEATHNYDPNDWFPCGAAYVMIKPRNSKFSNWLKKNEFGRDSEHMHCILISNDLNTQAMTPQVNYASAVAKVLREEFNINASVWSFID